MSRAARRSRVPPSVAVPPPGAPASLDPLFRTWEAGRKFHRCYGLHWGSRDVYAGDDAHRGRFHSFVPIGGSSPLPVLYGAGDFDGAVYETVFHDVPIRGIKTVPHAKLLHRIVVALVPGRDLTLVDLTSDGLRRLGLAREELIASGPRSYPATAAWARALHAHSETIDGLLWVSRQRDTSLALLLYGDRVEVDDVTVSAGDLPLALSAGRGLDAVSAAASRAGITITGLV